MKHYDYIFAGAGLAALLTAYRMAVSGSFTQKNILLLDPDAKATNDRTWCFWEEGAGEWDSIVYRNWNTAVFANEDFRTELDFDDYHYKMIRGADFYAYVKRELAKHPNILMVQDKVISFNDRGTDVLVKTTEAEYTCKKLFNSIYCATLPAMQKKYPVLQQHFIGWHIKTDNAVFNPEVPVFMDFSIPQKGNTRFMYVLPFSETEAIVEYTLFSKDLLPEKEYEQAIADYVQQLGAGGYTIVDKERGSIPMTSYRFWNVNSKNIMHIGSTGGWTKASTGYTFKNASKLSKRLVNFLQKEAPLNTFYKVNRFWFYDLLLLDILGKTNEKGGDIFAAMFCKGKAAPVFRFLDEETSLWGDLKVIWSCPKGLFIKALLGRLF